jgi:hypothetical protein
MVMCLYDFPFQFSTFWKGGAKLFKKVEQNKHFWKGGAKLLQRE